MVLAALMDLSEWNKVFNYEKYEDLENSRES